MNRGDRTYTSRDTNWSLFHTQVERVVELRLPGICAIVAYKIIEENSDAECSFD